MKELQKFSNATVHGTISVVSKWVFRGKDK